MKRIAKKKPARVIQKKGTPALVKVISILYFVSAFSALLAGVSLIIGALMGTSFLTAVDIIESIRVSMGDNSISLWLANILLKSLFLGGIVFLIIALLEFLVGKSLWKGRNWARIFTIVIMGISLISSLISLDILGIVLSALIGGYLLFSKEVKRTFSK